MWHPHGVSAQQQESLLEQVGGISGLIYSTVPILVFVPVNAVFGLTVALWSALGAATAILLWRLVTGAKLQPAITGFFGVGISAFIAYRTGDAKGYFLFGIYTSLLYGAVFAASILVRRPLVGVIWGALSGTGGKWRGLGRARTAYDLATAAWTVVFIGRYLVQNQLYDADRTGWLAVARIAMGWPLAVVAMAVTVWAVRRADAAVIAAADPGPDGRVAPAAEPTAESADAVPTGPDPDGRPARAPGTETSPADTRAAGEDPPGSVLPGDRQTQRES